MALGSLPALFLAAHKDRLSFLCPITMSSALAFVAAEFWLILPTSVTSLLPFRSSCKCTRAHVSCALLLQTSKQMASLQHQVRDQVRRSRAQLLPGRSVPPRIPVSCLCGELRVCLSGLAFFVCCSDDKSCFECVVHGKRMARLSVCFFQRQGQKRFVRSACVPSRSYCPCCSSTVH
jgi:hypothetical protein